MNVHEAFAIACRWPDRTIVPGHMQVVDIDCDLFPCNAAALAVLSGLLPACSDDADLRHAVRAGVKDVYAGLWDVAFVGEVALAVRNRILGAPAYREG